MLQFTKQGAERPRTSPFCSLLRMCKSIFRVGQNCNFAPRMTVCMATSLSKIPYIRRMYVYMDGWMDGWMDGCMVLANPKQLGSKSILLYLSDLEGNMGRIGQNHTFIGIYGVHTVFLAGKSPYTWSLTVQIYGSGQP